MRRYGPTGALYMLAAGALITAACGGGGGTKTPTPVAATTTAAASPSGRTSTATAGAATVAPTAIGGTATASGRTYSAAEAKTIVDATVLLPTDLPPGWKTQTDNTTDNAAAAVADPKASASFERCGRLLGRTAVNQPPEVVSSFLAGETLAFFSSVTVYASEAGAIDCSTEAAQRFARPGELARALGSLFINPDAVEVMTVDYPQTADGSFAATLTGQINASGTVVDLTVLIVAFRNANVTGVVGAARSGQSPPTAELAPYVDKTLQRIMPYVQ